MDEIRVMRTGISKWMISANTKKTIRKVIVLILDSMSKGTQLKMDDFKELDDEIVEPVIKEQYQIGWAHFMKGSMIK